MGHDAEEFCVELRPRLVGALFLYCRDRLLAEELAQDTLVVVWDRWDRVRLLDDPSAWAYRVAMNRAKSRFRRRAAERRALARLQGWVPRPEDVPDDAEAIAVRRAVGLLPERQRAALVLRFYVRMTVAETAVAMSCAEGTVKSLTNQALRSLRSRLAAVGETAGER